MIECMATMLDASLLRQIVEGQAGLLQQVIRGSNQARDIWRQGDHFVIFLQQVGVDVGNSPWPANGQQSL